MEANKRHKRSGSTGHKPGYSLPYLKKRHNMPKIHGKFQVGRAKPERKNIDVDLAAALSTMPSLATATVQLLNAYTAGTSPNNTLGRRVTNLSLLIRMNIKVVGGTTPSEPTTVRALVIYDRQPSGATPSIATIFGSSLYGVSSPLNLAYSDRFSVLMDEKRELGGVGVTGTLTNTLTELPPAVCIDRYVKCKLPSEATGSFTGAIAGLAEGAIFIVAFSDIAAASNPPVIVSGVSRIRFMDA